MSNDNAAIAAWAARKKQRKLEAQATAKALQSKVDEQKFAPLDWGSCPVEKKLEKAFAKHGMKVITPEESQELLKLYQQRHGTVEQFREQHQTLPIVKGLSFDPRQGHYRARAYKNNRQVNLYWGRSLDKALEALRIWRETGVNTNA